MGFIITATTTWAPRQRATNGDGEAVWAADYLPFGQADVTVSIVTNNLRFAGQYFDSETGLHYNWNRYYDPTLGRYLRADPIGLEGGINPYSYALNSPINLIDPDGQLIGTIAAGVTIAITGGVVYIVVKCFKDCGEQYPCNVPEDPDRAKNIEKCTNRCMPFLKFLGWQSPKGLGVKAGGAIGGAIGNANAN